MEFAELAREPNILARFEQDMKNLGAVGEERVAKLIFLAMTSRLFNRPVSVVVKGPSSAGKSYTTEQTLRFFPAFAYYTLSGMSERFLVYDEEPLAHRMIVVSEAAGLVGDFATYLVGHCSPRGGWFTGPDCGSLKTDDGETAGESASRKMGRPA